MSQAIFWKRKLKGKKVSGYFDRLIGLGVQLGIQSLPKRNMLGNNSVSLFRLGGDKSESKID